MGTEIIGNEGVGWVYGYEIKIKSVITEREVCKNSITKRKTENKTKIN